MLDHVQDQLDIREDAPDAKQQTIAYLIRRGQHPSPPSASLRVTDRQTSGLHCASKGPMVSLPVSDPSKLLLEAFAIASEETYPSAEVYRIL
jgi:hypothetical protein